MVDRLGGWVSMVASLIILVAFLELLLPNTKMNQMVRVVLGLFVIVAVLDAAAAVLDIGLDLDLDLTPIQDTFAPTSESAATSRGPINSTATTAATIAGEKLAATVTSRLRDLGEAVSSVACDVNEGGELELITIYLNQEDSLRPRSDAISVPPVSVGAEGTSMQQSTDARAQPSSSTVDRVTKQVSDILGVTANKIRVAGAL